MAWLTYICTLERTVAKPEAYGKLVRSSWSLESFQGQILAIRQFNIFKIALTSCHVQKLISIIISNPDNLALFSKDGFTCLQQERFQSLDRQGKERNTVVRTTFPPKGPKGNPVAVV